MPYTDPDKRRQFSCVHYEKYKETYKKNLHARRQKNRDYLASLKVGWKCACGESDPICCDFHHREDKDLKVSEAVKAWGLKRLMKEVAKCDMICSNCHRKLHRDEKF